MVHLFQDNVGTTVRQLQFQNDYLSSIGMYVNPTSADPTTQNWPGRNPMFRFQLTQAQCQKAKIASEQESEKERNEHMEETQNELTGRHSKRSEAEARKQEEKTKTDWLNEALVSIQLEKAEQSLEYESSVSQKLRSTLRTEKDIS